MQNGIYINGMFYQLNGLTDLIDSITEDIASKVASKLSHEAAIKRQNEKTYTSKEIAALLKRSVSTVTRHLQIGLLKGNKIGKSWIISELELNEYYNQYKGED